MKHQVNKIAADGWVRGWDRAGIVCAMCAGSFAFQNKGSLLEALSLQPPPQKGASPSAVKIVCLVPLPETSRKEHKSVIFTQHGHKVMFSLRIKPGEAEEWGLLFAGDTQRKRD